MTLRSHRARLTALTAILAVTAIMLAACGSASSASSSQSSTTAASASAGATFNRTKFRACLKAHGVTLPARPPGAGTGPQPGSAGSQSGSSGSRSGAGRRPSPFRGSGAFANPKLRAALQACGAGRFRGRPGGRRFTPSHSAVLKFVACVKKHGYKLPAPNFSGKGSIFPPSIEGNAKFQAAARTCGSLLRPPGARGQGAGPPGSGAQSTSGA